MRDQDRRNELMSAQSHVPEIEREEQAHRLAWCHPSLHAAVALTTMLIMGACADSKNVVGLANHGLSRQDSVQQGYFRRVPPPTHVKAAECTENCPALVSADPPSLFQGYTQPGPVTLTFSGDAGSVTVTGRGAIQCSSGQYGTLVGYDSAGVELGRVNLQLIDPSDCSPPGNPDDVTFGAEATLLTSAPIATAVILPMSPLQFLVYGECCGHASATYSISVSQGNMFAINLACSGPVLRGEIVSCTASPVDPAKTLVVSGWQFTSDANDFNVDRSVDVASATWQGILAVDGHVTVAGTVSGVAGQSLPVSVATLPRDWHAKVTAKLHQIVNPDTLPSRPDGELLSKVVDGELRG